jgi:hypothetical protein
MSAALDGESYDPNRELDGTKGNLLGISFAVSMRQGSRPYMEDVTVAQAVPGHENFSVRLDSLPTLFIFHSHFMNARFSVYSMVMGANEQQILQRRIFLKFCLKS